MAEAVGQAADRLHPRYQPDPPIRDRIIARQGRLHAHQRIDATRTALVVIDMQNYFCASDFPAGNVHARAIVPTINQAASAMRAAGGLVVWVRTTARGAPERWARHHRQMLTTERAARRLEALDPAHPGYRLYAGLQAEDRDLFIDKIMYSALIPGSSDLDRELRARGIDTLLIAGTATNVCCESTARDAMMLDYGVVMLADANAAANDAAHRHALDTIALYFGDVMQVEDAIARLAR